VGVAASATFFVARMGELGDPKRIAGQAWDLAETEVRYEEFIGQVRGLVPVTPCETFAAQVRLVQEWRRFPFLDPGLPAELLPPRRSGTEAAALFRRRRSRWKPAADTVWRGFAGAG
jgi:phenylacetic acid degradation operon negative regulatory protein